MREGDTSAPEGSQVTVEAVKDEASALRLRVVHADGAVEVVADLDRRRTEALALELRAVVRRHGLTVRSVRVLPDAAPDVAAHGADRESTQ